MGCDFYQSQLLFPAHPFYVPFPAHGFLFILILLIVSQFHWAPRPRILCTVSPVVGCDTGDKISCPAAVERVIGASENIDVVCGMLISFHEAPLFFYGRNSLRSIPMLSCESVTKLKWKSKLFRSQIIIEAIRILKFIIAYSSLCRCTTDKRIYCDLHPGGIKQEPEDL